AAPFRWFNRTFAGITSGYTAGVRFFLRRAALGLVLFVAIGAMTALLFFRIPGSMVPDEDQGSVFTVALLPPAASMTRTQAAMAKINDSILKRPEVSDVVSFSGFDLLAGVQKTSAGIS